LTSVTNYNDGFMDRSIALDFHRDAERVQKGLYQNMIDAKQKGIGNTRADSKTSL